MKTLYRAAQINAADVGDLQEALTLLPPQGGDVYLPAGCYEIDRTVTCRLHEGQHLCLHGDGRATVLRFTATDGSPLLAIDGVPNSWWPDLRFTLRDLTFVGQEGSGDALHLRWPNDALIDACAFFGFGGTAITVTPNATNVTIRDCWMRDCRRVLHADNLHHLTFHGNQTRSRDGGVVQSEHLYIGKHCREVRIVNNHLAYGQAEAIILDGTAQHVIANNTIEGFTIGIRVRDCRDLTLSANYLHTPTGVLIEGDSRGVVVSGNLFTDNSERALCIRDCHGSGGHVISGNVIRQSVYNDGQGGIDLGEAVDCVVQGNVLEDIDRGPALDGHPGAAAANGVSDTAERARRGLAGPAPHCDADNPFQPLHAWLKAQPATTRRVTLTWWEWRRMAGGDLPAAAEADRGWWHN
ncbi:MAG: right-handed parallel beta-helix repeat-containing protein, partial [Lentisphaerae bacterium]|nr:right-handed parallel beta-helix repeat-containing protein [Lentisphaerota bacterium]